MMAVRHYTRDELLYLRDSPLVQRPENLPSIEQWIEYVFADKESREKLRIPHSEPQPTQKRQPPSKSGAGGEASPMGNFSTGLRPSLMGARSSGRGGGEYPSCALRYVLVQADASCRGHLVRAAQDDLSVQSECLQAVRLWRQRQRRCGRPGCAEGPLLSRKVESQEHEREGR